MRAYVNALGVFGALVLLILAVTTTAMWYAGSVPAPALSWAFVPQLVPDGAPFAAWYEFSSLGGADAAAPGSVSVQLRICSVGSSECVIGARKAPTAGRGELVTATRALQPGTYDVDLLVLRPDRFGVPRTVQSLSSPVLYGAEDGGAGLAQEEGTSTGEGPATVPAYGLEQCGRPAAIAGSTVWADGALRASTNALVAVPGCSSERVLLMSGTDVRGVGPAVSLTLVGAGGRRAVWHGYLTGAKTAVDLPIGYDALISFTNDLASGAEDRNLIVEVVNP